MPCLVKPGQVTRDEIIADLQAQGIPVQAANPFFDPVTGELLQVDVSLPEASAAQAKSAIDANSGVAATTPALPDPLFIFDLTDINLATVDLAVSSGVVLQQITVNAKVAGTNALGARTQLGAIRDTGAGDVFVNGPNNTLGRLETLLFFFNTDNGGPAALSYPANDVSLDFVAGSQILGYLAALDIGIAAAGALTRGYYPDANGKLYEGYREESGAGILINRTYAEAVAAGAV